MTKRYVATVQLLFDADSDADAADAVSAMLTDNLQSNSAIHDWQYAKFGGQYLYATVHEHFIGDNPGFDNA